MTSSRCASRRKGAGADGQWLIKIGIGVVGFAGWLIGIYTYLAGRTPP